MASADNKNQSVVSGEIESNFSTEWTADDALHLIPHRPSKLHRAWERQPRSPFAQQSRFRKVWRRYSLKSQHTTPRDIIFSSPSGSQQSPQKVTKKLCLADGKKHYRGAAVRWEKERPIRIRKEQTRETVDLPANQSNPALEQSLTAGEQSVEVREKIATEIRPVRKDYDENGAISGRSTRVQMRSPGKCEGSKGMQHDDMSVHAPPNAPESRLVPTEHLDRTGQDLLGSSALQLPTNGSSVDVDNVQLDGFEVLQETSPNQANVRKDSSKSVDFMLDSAETMSPHSSKIIGSLEDLEESKQESTEDTCIPSSDDNVSETLPVNIAIGDEFEHELQDFGPEQLGGAPNTMPTTDLKSDTAVLQAYLDRKQANRAGNLQADSIAKRTSLDHRRDSDAVRQALASPRIVLEDKDVNSPTPSKPSNVDLDATDIGTPIKVMNDCKDSATNNILSTDQGIATPARRSTRKRSRIPPPSSGVSANPPTSIAIRRGADGIILKRTDAQEMAIMTRANTRKNKGAALFPKPRLAKLVAASIADETGPEAGKDIPQSIEWADPLVQGMQSPAKEEPEESEEPVDTAQEDSIEQHTPKPRIRKLRGLGNGTPAKGLLTTSQFPPEIELSAANPANGVEGAKPRRLPSPRKLTFTAVNEGKENRAVASKKSGIPVGVGSAATRTSARKRAAGV
ncbi:MAG: hypothetical protein M1821_006141 [Bathelium mastoideum]|nr:MAG: hypothetical protein M1821_006141 [Bathelium mastoideum]